LIKTESNPSVFVTYGWCRSAYAVAASLGRKGLSVHIGDASSLAMSRFSRYAASFTRLPDFFIEPDRYIDALLEALKKTGSQVLLPCHEDVGLISRYRDRFPEHVRTSVPDWKTYQSAEDKLNLMEIASRSGCPAPQFYPIHTQKELDGLANELNFPIVLKTRIGNSAKGVAIAQNVQDLKKKYHALVDTYHLSEDRWPFLQEYLPGRAVGVCALYNQGKRVAWFGEEYIRCKEPGRFGTSTLRRTWHDPETIEQALTVLDALQWHGLAHLDLIQDRQGVFKIIEINPRPWGAMALAVHAGIDFPWLWYRLALGEAIDLVSINPQNLYCRWILGDCLAVLNRLKQGRLLETMNIFKWHSGCRHDDFQITDPLPFFFQYLDYAGKFIRSGGNMNPAAGGMVR
jgi:predicted ATP-grasp superfamily ATP-dependent carboligase